MKILLTTIILFLIIFSSESAKAKEKKVIYHTGDLIFQNLDCGELCDAIESVTHGYKDMKFSHIGLVYIRHDSVFVIEAIGSNVHLTLLNDFLSRSNNSDGSPKIIVGRLKKEFQNIIPGSIEFALMKMGVPYDDEFIYNNNKYYCSELIYDSFKTGNNNSPFFNLEPMTFNDPSSGKILPVWRSYFNDLQKPVPEGQPGCNPAGISRSNKIEIIYQ